MQNMRANETHSYTPNDKYISLAYVSHCYAMRCHRPVAQTPACLRLGYRRTFWVFLV